MMLGNENYTDMISSYVRKIRFPLYNTDMFYLRMNLIDNDQGVATVDVIGNITEV